MICRVSHPAQCLASNRFARSTLAATMPTSKTSAGSALLQAKMTFRSDADAMDPQNRLGI